jgi:hypothetical protein
VDGRPLHRSEGSRGRLRNLEVRSRAEAIDAAKWLMQLHLDHWPGWEREAEVRQIMDGVDIGSSSTI